MIVTFRSNPSNICDVNGAYVNFLRCVTAIATANAGTTSLTVNPYTSVSAINNSYNCIVSIDCNAEAGGWLTSSAHNVPSSANNVAATFTSIATATAFSLKADLYKQTTGKVGMPFYKLCFHGYNDFTTTSTWGFTAGAATTLRQGKAGVTFNNGANMLITYGCSTASDWSYALFPPATGGTSTGFNLGSQTTSYTMNGDVFSALQNNGPGLSFCDSTVEYKMAVGADYCVIWEQKVGDTHTAGYFTGTTTGAGSTYFGNARYGSIFYMGTRSTQPWEDQRTDNPPWVAWNHTVSNFGAGTGANPYTQDGVCAYMAGLSNAGALSQSPTRKYTVNTYASAFFPQSFPYNTSVAGSGAGTVDSNSRNGLDGPIFYPRNWNSTDFESYPAGASITNNGNSTNIMYHPQTDPVTGTLVPGAYPILIKSSADGQYNQGGKCLGIYKSLSGAYTTSMRPYWQSSNQTFTVDGVQYIPLVIYEDMWLVKFA